MKEEIIKRALEKQGFDLSKISGVYDNYVGSDFEKICNAMEHVSKCYYLKPRFEKGCVNNNTEREENKKYILSFLNDSRGVVKEFNQEVDKVKICFDIDRLKSEEIDKISSIRIDDFTIVLDKYPESNFFKFH